MHKRRYVFSLPVVIVVVAISHAVSALVMLALAAQAVTLGTGTITAILVTASAAGLVMTFPVCVGVQRIQDAGVHIHAGADALEPRGLSTWPVMALFAHVLRIANRLPLLRQRGHVSIATSDRLEEDVIASLPLDERCWLEWDLHEGLKQHVFAVGARVALACRELDQHPAVVPAILDDVQQLLHEIDVEINSLLQYLRPTVGLTLPYLVAALRDHCAAFSYQTRASVSFLPATLPDHPRLPPGALPLLQQVVHATFVTITRQTRPEHVQVRLEQHTEALMLEIQSDGAGFKLALGVRGPGLSILAERMQELGGHMEIQSAPGAGMSLRAEVPLLPRPD